MRLRDDTVGLTRLREDTVGLTQLLKEQSAHAVPRRLRLPALLDARSMYDRSTAFIRD